MSAKVPAPVSMLTEEFLTAELSGLLKSSVDLTPEHVVKPWDELGREERYDVHHKQHIARAREVYIELCRRVDKQRPPGAISTKKLELIQRLFGGSRQLSGSERLRGSLGLSLGNLPR